MESGPVDLPRSFHRIRDYVWFSREDSRLLRRLLPGVEPRLGAIIDDFYRHIEADPGASRVLTGGAAESVHLQAAIGRRHVQVGLEQAYMVGGMHVLRSHLKRITRESADRRRGGTIPTLRAVDRVLDVALALMLGTYREDSLRKRGSPARSRC